MYKVFKILNEEHKKCTVIGGRYHILCPTRECVSVCTDWTLDYDSEIEPELLDEIIEGVWVFDNCFDSVETAVAYCLSGKPR